MQPTSGGWGSTPPPPRMKATPLDPYGRAGDSTPTPILMGVVRAQGGPFSLMGPTQQRVPPHTQGSTTHIKGITHATWAPSPSKGTPTHSGGPSCTKVRVAHTDRPIIPPHSQRIWLVSCSCGHAIGMSNRWAQAMVMAQAWVRAVQRMDNASRIEHEPERTSKDKSKRERKRKREQHKAKPKAKHEHKVSKAKG